MARVRHQEHRQVAPSMLTAPPMDGRNPRTCRTPGRGVTTGLQQVHSLASGSLCLSFLTCQMGPSPRSYREGPRGSLRQGRPRSPPSLRSSALPQLPGAAGGRAGTSHRLLAQQGPPQVARSASGLIWNLKHN